MKESLSWPPLLGLPELTMGAGCDVTPFVLDSQGLQLSLVSPPTHTTPAPPRRVPPLRQAETRPPGS